MSPRRKIPKNKPRVLPTARDLAADRAAVERCLDRGAKLLAQAQKAARAADIRRGTASMPEARCSMSPFAAFS